MFKTLVLLSFLTLTVPALAQNAFGHVTGPSNTLSTVQTEALPSSLHDTMKAMSKALKSINVGDSAASESNAQAADLFAALSIHAKDFTPDSVSSLPAGEQFAAKSDYDKMMDESASLGRDLAAAFRKNDSAAAQALLDKLATEKKQGHGKYK